MRKVTYGKLENSHEIVLPTDPLPIWYRIFNSKNVEQYVTPHWHQGIELDYLLHGTISDFTINSIHHTVHAGQIILVNTQEIHSVRCALKIGDISLSIIFPFEYVSHLYPEIKNQMIDINDPGKFSEKQKLSFSKLQSLLMEFVKLDSVKSSFKYLRQQELIDQVLMILMRDFTRKIPAKKRIGQKKIYIINRLQLITQYINKHYQEKINLTLIARHSNLSREYLSRFFKKQMGITVDTYINNVRAQHAYNDLLNKQAQTLTYIAISNGFSGLRTMNRTLKNLYHKTASQIRREA